MRAEFPIPIDLDLICNDNDIEMSIEADDQTVDMDVEGKYVVGKPYEGPYDVTPSEVLQTLQTEGFSMGQNVTVQPIPSQYIIPSGTITITENCIADVAQYANVDVSVADDFPWAGGVYF